LARNRCFLLHLHLPAGREKKGGERGEERKGQGERLPRSLPVWRLCAAQQKKEEEKRKKKEKGRGEGCNPTTAAGKNGRRELTEGFVDPRRGRGGGWKKRKRRGKKKRKGKTHNITTFPFYVFKKKRKEKRRRRKKGKGKGGEGEGGKEKILFSLTESER